MKQILIVFVVVLASASYLFSFWRKLKGDYFSKDIFKLALINLFFLITVFSLYSYLGQFLFFSHILATFLLILILFKAFRFRFYETFEAGLYSTILFYLFLLPVLFYLNRDMFFLLDIILSLLFLLGFNLINRSYKRFNWYKSGKIGFAGLTSIGLFFLTRGVILLIFQMLNKFGNVAVLVLNGIFAFVFFMLVYKLADDI